VILLESSSSSPPIGDGAVDLAAAGEDTLDFISAVVNSLQMNRSLSPLLRASKMDASEQTASSPEFEVHHTAAFQIFAAPMAKYFSMFSRSRV
jgi:hypothetical protein